MLNLTPHTIRIYARTPYGEPDLKTFVDIPPSGMVARVETVEEDAGVRPTNNANHDGSATARGGTYWNTLVVRRTLGAVSGLPEDGTECLVSSMVLSACPGRPNTYAPDTGPTAVRDAEGRILGVTQLVTA